MEAALGRLVDSGMQVIWQTGKNFGDRGLKAAKGLRGVVVTPFITDMASAYAAADLVVSRAGAGSISELELLGKPCVLVPSPNVAEERGAAVLVTDAEARERLADTVVSLMADEGRRAAMATAISALAMPDSDELIADEVEKIIKSKK